MEKKLVGGLMFVRGMLTENMPGATFNGVVYDRSLKIVHDSGSILQVLDDCYPSPPISHHLKIDRWYEFLLMFSIGTPTRYSLTPPSNNAALDMMATVENPDWRPPLNPQHHYRHFSPRLYHNAGGFVMVSAMWGHVLFGPDDILGNLQMGGYVRWYSTRLELLAVF